MFTFKDSILLKEVVFDFNIVPLLSLFLNCSRYLFIVVNAL